MSNEKYNAHYQVTDANDKVVYQGQVEVTKTGDIEPQSQESKESLAHHIQLSLDVTVTKLEKIN